MHTSKEFWTENANKLEEKDYQLLKVLLKDHREVKGGKHSSGTGGICSTQLTAACCLLPDGMEFFWLAEDEECTCRASF